MAEEKQDTTEEHNDDDSSGKKNVNYEDFKQLQDSVGNLNSKLTSFLDSQNNNNDDKPKDKTNDDKKDDHDDNEDHQKHDFKLPDEVEKRISKNEAELAAYKAKDAHNKLVSLAKSEAKNKGVNIDNIVENLVGKDEETTKANVNNFAETITTNVKSKASTDNGFRAKSTQFKNSDDFMSTVYKSKGLVDKQK